MGARGERRDDREGGLGGGDAAAHRRVRAAPAPESARSGFVWVHVVVHGANPCGGCSRCCRRRAFVALVLRVRRRHARVFVGFSPVVYLTLKRDSQYWTENLSQPDRGAARRRERPRERAVPLGAVPARCRRPRRARRRRRLTTRRARATRATRAAASTSRRPRPRPRSPRPSSP